MERTSVLNSSQEFGGEVLATREAVRLSACRMPQGSSARDLLESACGALRAVSLEELDEDGLCRVVAGAGRVNALADALTLRAAGLLEALRAGSAREALVAGAKLSGRAAKRVTEAARQVEEMPNVGRMLEAGDLTLESVFALGSAARQCGAAVVDGSDELLYQAATRDGGSFSRVARRFAQRHDPSAGGDLLKGQRNSRKADLFVGGDGMGVLKGEVDEFHADAGQTDIENLAALCNSCHLWLHRTNRRVVREVDAHGVIAWSTAPRGRDPDGCRGGDLSDVGSAEVPCGHGNHGQGDVLEASKIEVGGGFAGRDPPAAG